MPNARSFRAAIILAPLLLAAACDPSVAPSATGGQSSCEGARTVEGWAVTAGLEKGPTDEIIISRWEARRLFSTHFELRVTYDTSENSEPFLQVWHDYKSGEFVMRLTDNSQFGMALDAQFAVTPGTLPPGAFELISRQPVRIEHTSHTNKWSVYETSGLPEAIGEAIVDLEAAKQLLTEGKCRL